MEDVTGSSIIVVLVIGLVAGWLASLIVGGGNLIKYLIWGLLGSIVGGLLLPYLGIEIETGYQILNAIIVSTIGAVVLMLVARLVG